MPVLTESNLTAGEKLVMMRRRHGRFGRGIAQRTLARNIQVTRRQIQLAEDDETVPTEWPGPLKKFSAQFRDVQKHELCFVMRRRKKQSLQALATELGLSRFWVQQMELGREKADVLVAHWKL